MGKLILILGGARSGKSYMAEAMAQEMGGRVTFVATAEARDEEMKHRIAKHRAGRPPEWQTIEEPLDLASVLMETARNSDIILVDCLTLWVSNHLCAEPFPDEVAESAAALDSLIAKLERQLASLLETARSCPATLLLVSNEVGLGLVPADPLNRAYRDLLGMVNCRLAREADQVLLMVAGLPVDVKQLSRGQP